jgi:hypothetical protein
MIERSETHLPIRAKAMGLQGIKASYGLATRIIVGSRVYVAETG